MTRSTLAPSSRRPRRAPLERFPHSPPPSPQQPYLKGEANIRLFSEHVEEVARRLNVVDGVMLPPPGGCPGARAARNAIREAFATLPPPLDVVLAGVPATAQRAMVSSYMHGHRPWPTAAVAYVTKWVAEARAAGRLAPAGAKPRMSQIHALTGDLYRAVGLYVGAVRLPAIVHRYFDAGRQDELTFINPIILGRRRGAKRATPQAQPEGASKAKKARLQ